MTAFSDIGYQDRSKPPPLGLTDRGGGASARGVAVAPTYAHLAHLKGSELSSALEKAQSIWEKTRTLRAKRTFNYLKAMALLDPTAHVEVAPVFKTTRK